MPFAKPSTTDPIPPVIDPVAPDPLTDPLVPPTVKLKPKRVKPKPSGPAYKVLAGSVGEHVRDEIVYLEDLGNPSEEHIAWLIDTGHLAEVDAPATGA